jgi:dTMP kinase
MAPHARGKLIVFEGLDRSGKSTQCECLVQHLRRNGQNVEHIRFPDRTTPIGKMINDYLAGQTQTEDHVIHLLFSANRWEKARDIERLIEEGTTVVVDRYYYSGCVYTAAKHIPGLDLAWCRQPEVGLPRPDKCIFLDITAEKAAERGGYGVERYEKREMQDRVRELFAELRKHDDEGQDITVIDAGRSVEEVEKSIQEIVEQVHLEMSKRGLPLRRVEPWR